MKECPEDNIMYDDDINFSSIPYGPREIIGSFIPYTERYPDVYGREYVDEEANKILSELLPDCVGLGSGWEFYLKLSNMLDDMIEKNINILEFASKNDTPEYMCIARSMVRKDNNIYIKNMKELLDRHDEKEEQEERAKSLIGIFELYGMIHDVLQKTESSAKNRDAIQKLIINCLSENFIRENPKYRTQLINLYERIFDEAIPIQYANRY